MKHPVHPCDEIRGFGEHHSRVQFETLENIGDKSIRHPVEAIEPDPVKVQDLARQSVAFILSTFRALSVNQRETVFLRLWGMPWDSIAAVLHLESHQSAEWQLRAALRKCPTLKTLFPKTNNNRRTE